MKNKKPLEELSLSGKVKRLRVESGLCYYCPNPKSPLYATTCIDCAKRRTKSHRERTGHKEWKPGGWGKPPNFATEEDRNPPGREERFRRKNSAATRKYQTKVRKQRKVEGLCVNCGKGPPKPNRYSCHLCLVVRRERRKRKQLREAKK